MGAVAHLAGLLIIPVGAIFCFAGYRLIKIILGLVGFVAGAALGAAVAHTWLQFQSAFVFVFAFIGGIAGALLATFLFFAGVFLLGAGFGASLGLVIANEMSIDPLIPALIVAIAGGVLALIIQKFVIILSTAAVGSWGMVAGLTAILGFFPPQLLVRNPWATWSLLRGYGWVLILWAVLLAAGLFMQYRSAPAKQPQKEKKED